MLRYRNLSCSIASLLLATASLQAAIVGTAFTYQGQLNDSGAPANGAYDLDFRVYDAASGGSQVGADVLVSDQSVANGLFTAQLDFGNAFNGAALWLEIAVRPGASAGSYTTLTPRQPLTATPYALFAKTGGGWTLSGSAVTNVPNTFVGVNRTTPVTGNEYFGVQCPNTTSYGGMYMQTAGANTLAFYGYSLNNGTDKMWTEYDGASKNWNVHNGGTALSVSNSGKVGINNSTPAARLDIADSTNSIALQVNSTVQFGYAISATGDTGVAGAGTTGVFGDSDDPNFGIGVYGHANGAGAYGIEGHNDNSNGVGVYAAGGHGTGLYADTVSGSAVSAHTSGAGTAVYGSNNNSNSTGWAGYFNGRVNVTGNLSKAGGSFKIDHPLDPANKYLYHSFVESPDMMNIYNGEATLDANGETTVTLPEWFETLNRDFRYQLTCVGGYAPVYVAQKVQNNQFRIAGGQAGLEVSWQITGIRHDKWADANRIPVEEEKAGIERGRFIHPELYGAGDEQAIDAAARVIHEPHVQHQRPAAARPTQD